MVSIGDVPIIYGEGHIPTVARPSGGWGGRLDDCDLIEVLDLTGTSSKDPLDLSLSRHWTPKALNYTLEVMFAVIGFGGP